ncbi:hypothetical protein JCM14202_253 [Agrilactobacillus composti DSM 18527 = JCM 14202]|nr:hypothetical protein [Agrilactobacillus composti]MCH4171353.1 hypothetical protein [Lactobacillus sp.]GAF38443.1 hypothetical protein JCM14202_253 [Agrilactobacillus composti DSM 18527 = JCM 14202]
MRVFDVLKLVTVNHGELPVQQVIMTDPSGKPNSVLTDLLHDVLNKTQLFVDLKEVNDSADIIDTLHNVTPLPDDVLDEYDKILTQEVIGLNFATRKSEIELVYDELV